MAFVRMSVQVPVESQGVPTQRNVKRNSVLVSQIDACDVVLDQWIQYLPAPVFF
jgi:hypothetical protein